MDLLLKNGHIPQSNDTLGVYIAVSDGKIAAIMETGQNVDVKK